MNIAHLRKQAKNFKSIYSVLVATHGTSITLSAAQDAIARTHGFPSWKAAVNKASADDSTVSKAEKAQNNGVALLIRASYEFLAEEEASLAIAFDDDDGEPSGYAMGREVILALRLQRDREQVDREARALDELMEQIGGFSGGYDAFTPKGLTKMLSSARDAVARCPLYLDGWNQIAGILYTQKKFSDGLEVAEPLVTALLDLLPADGAIQVCYPHLENRPFFRLAHCYLLLLHKLGRHREADALADRMFRLWPSDNIGFRFLLTRTKRNAA